MNKQKKIELKVGIVSVLAIIIFILGISFVKGISVSAPKNLVKFRFDNSGGITDGSPVLVNGVRRGLVKTVENDNGTVLITADLDYISDLRADCYARITILEVTGGKKIELYPGRSQNSFNPQNEIPGISTADIADLIATLGSVSSDAASLVKNLDTLTQSFNYLLQDRQFIAKLDQIAINTSELTQNLNVLLKENYTTLQSTINNLSSLISDLKKTFTKNEPNFNKIIADLDTAIKNANSILERLQNTANYADKTLANLNGIADEVRSGNGIANKLIYDKKLSSELDSTIKSINVLLNQINQHGVNVNVRLGTRP